MENCWPLLQSRTSIIRWFWFWISYRYIEASYKDEADILELIKGLCLEIHTSILFSDHENLLIGELSELKVAGDVLGSANRDAFLG